MAKLTAAKLKSLLDRPGRYSDGDGLLLFVRSPGNASWVVRVQHNGKRRDYGVGSAKLYGLAEARDRAWEVRRAVADGRDPRTLWERPAALLQTFREAAEARFTAKAGDTGDKRQKQDKAMLAAYAYPSLGRLQVQSIDADRIAECLRPIWTAKPETAKQVRSLIVRTLRFTRPDGADFTKALTAAIGDKLPKQPRAGNFEAMPYQDVPGLMARLEPKTGMAALALRLLILCASRSGEVRGAKWDELDLANAVWIVPAERMKMKRSHRVPLSPQAVALLEQAKALRRSDHVFPSGKGEALSDMALTKTLRDMGLKCTAHGFRSSFRDWAAEQTSVPGEIAEAALAHAVPSAVEAAYKRTDFFDRRRELMEAWGRFAGDGALSELVEQTARK
jgi:integrase